MTERNDDENVEYGLVVAFPDGSPSFVNGFEAGSIWQRMVSGSEAEIKVTTHRENREVISRMAIAEGWAAVAEPLDAEEWDETTLFKEAAAPERPNPHGLHLIDGGLSTND